jgi:hypothetical protein
MKILRHHLIQTLPFGYVIIRLLDTSATIDTRLIVALLALLRLTGFLLAFHISLEQGLLKGHAFIGLKLPVGLLGLRGLTCCCLKGLTIAVIATAVQGVVGLVENTMGLAGRALSACLL